MGRDRERDGPPLRARAGDSLARRRLGHGARHRRGPLPAPRRPAQARREAAGSVAGGCRRRRGLQLGRRGAPMRRGAHPQLGERQRGGRGRRGRSGDAAVDENARALCRRVAALSAATAPPASQARRRTHAEPRFPHTRQAAPRSRANCSRTSKRTPSTSISTARMWSRAGRSKETFSAATGSSHPASSNSTSWTLRWPCSRARSPRAYL